MEITLSGWKGPTEGMAELAGTGGNPAKRADGQQGLLYFPGKAASFLLPCGNVAMDWVEASFFLVLGPLEGDITPPA